MDTVILIFAILISLMLGGLSVFITFILWSMKKTGDKH